MKQALSGASRACLGALHICPPPSGMQVIRAMLWVGEVVKAGLNCSPCHPSLAVKTVFVETKCQAACEVVQLMFGTQKFLDK